MSHPALTLTTARTPLARMRGLLGKRGLEQGHGLVIVPCNAIHTLGMKFAIDVRFFDRQGALVRTVLAVPPGKWLIWGGLSAHCVLETQAGDTTFSNLTQLPNEESHHD